MDQHPIPQDVTGFQFKLIGSMTVKQFGYVAVGVIAAVILYYLPLNSAWGVIFKIFFIPVFGASGVIIAFVPIEGRPIDVMAGNFSKALFSPNQYIYHKVGRRFRFSTVSFTKVQPTQATATTQKVVPQKQMLADRREQQLQALLLNSQGKVKNDLDKKEMAFLHTFAAPTNTATQPASHLTTKPATIAHTTIPATHHAVQPIPAIKPQGPLTTVSPSPAPLPDKAPDTTDSLTKKEAALEKQLQTAKQEEATQPAPAAAHQKVVELEKQVTEIHRQKEHLEQELALLKTQLSRQPANPQQTAPPAPQTTATGATTPQHVRNIPQGMTKSAGLPHVSDTPNVVVGIVKDSRGNVLPNMLVEVKDKESNPVRAFKTNPLGQFASATPLNPGTYTIELEDPKKQHSFDIIQVTANNQILLPIEIISHDAREALRQQLFN